MNKTFRVVAVVSLALILVLGGFAAGLISARAIGIGNVTVPIVRTDDPLTSQLDTVREYLEREALKQPNETSMTAGAISGLLEATGDKYATYFDPKHFDAFNEMSMGSFGGIGVTLGENKDGAAYVVEVFPDTPAQEAGIKTGDVFYKIDDTARDKWTTEEVVKRVRGEKGTEVVVAMKRKGEKKPVSFTLKRDTIEYPNTKGEIIDGVGYIRMAQFNQLSAEEITREIKALEKKGAKAFVLDLRENPGGLLSSAVDVTSLFIDDGVVVKVAERGKDPVVYRATGNKITDAPLVLLINDNSASASEIVAGALQDYGRATLVGVKSFGKGSVQTVRELPDGGAIKFTTAHYLTPKERAINGKGLTPEVVVKMKPEAQMDKKTDTQLKRAIEQALKELKAQ